MKNLYLLPSPNPSRLYYFGNESELRLTKYPNLFRAFERSTQHIYITSDEEIKEGDWCLSKLNEIILFGKNYTEQLYKKIILTTDQDLIKDGVQAIDDEFLKWFVKNPSCEEVEVEEFEPIYGHQNNSSSVLYKTIIPKEEPKQTDEKGRPMTYWGGLEEPKQETLEEALNKFVRTMLLDQSVYIDFLQCAEFGAKYQQERMYSEEEVHKIIESYQNIMENNPINTHYDKWFEQFKKK